MLRLLARRARAQWPLLAGLLAVVTIGVTSLGVCALLVTRTADRALEVVAATTAAEEVESTAYTVQVPGAAGRSVTADTRALLTAALAPFPTTTNARASSVSRELPSATAADGTAAQTYLSAVQDLPSRAALTAGRWPGSAPDPSAGPEAVVLENTARLLGLAPGSRVRIGAELAIDPAPALDVTVVGVVRPLAGRGWERDPLRGTGYDLAYQDGRTVQPVHAYGPFLLDLDTLFDSGSLLARLEVTARPDLSGATRGELRTVTGNLADADRRLERVLGDRVQILNLQSGLPPTMRKARQQQQVTAAAVLAVAVICCVLAATTLTLAGRLTAGVRTDETTLVSALGVSRGQFAAAATVEGGVLALVAAALAVPASSALHAGLTQLSPLADAGLAAGPAVNLAQLLTVAGTALTLTTVLVVSGIRRVAAPGDRHQTRELLARSGADLLLVAFAVIGWWQLHGRPDGIRTDAVRVIAPALILTAGVALALRVVPPALRRLDRLARRSRGLAFTVAVFEAARRPHAMAAGLLIGLACAAATFGVGLNATWDRAQRDQADLSVGTDLVVAVTGTPDAGDGAAIAAATGGTVRPAADRGVAVGQWVGSGGEPPRLVATDSTRAAELLRGRLDDDGGSWAELGPGLAPATPVAGIVVPAGAVPTIAGTSTSASPTVVTPRLLWQDGTGMRTACTGEAVPLDGATRPLTNCAPDDELRLVAVSLAATPAADGTSTDIAVTLAVPDSRPEAGWAATSAPPNPGQLSGAAVTVTGTARGAELRMTARVQLTSPEIAARTLVATAFPDPGPVPVAVSDRFADELDAGPGTPLSLSVGTIAVPVTVVEVLPAIPAAPGAAAILADWDALSRALVLNGNLEPVVDAWWVGEPARADAAARAADLHLGPVTTRAGEAARLVGSPPRAGLPAALRLLVPAAAALLLAGVILHVSFDLRVRAVEVARLRALGMFRREIQAVLLGQHAGVVLSLLAAGVVVGALATRVVAPLMIRSDLGGTPVPAVAPTWPWVAETVLVALLLLGCAVAATAVVLAQARRADAAQLRVAS
ncbi:permease [Solwaraspora sp. WMMD1047]|uniref:FtsX-like permease family protein n=1 Tax=Solwaraspora sp. WMMD1047 TaxID=3016102 RepID=UPI0024160E1E|nr:FtsX-like permease family protein [Solwaraspora sp. WMMD1047]MDG4830717.1 permease [Solwaraspora sp. WMMD1047]